MDKMQPIGVLDSGVGGLSVLKCLHQMLPYEDFIYVGDTARTPYGTRSEQEIRGFVGEIIKTNMDVIKEVLENNFIPVISTIGYDEQGNCYNINADTVAAQIAGDLKAEALISMTDIVGLLRDINDESTIIQKVFISDIPALIADGIIKGGMIPKIDSMTQAIRNGCTKAFIIDGRVPHSILMELLTDEGMGTMFKGR